MRNTFIHFLRTLVEHFPKLAMTYRYARDAFSSMKTPSYAPIGYYFGGNDTMANGSFEVEETAILKRAMNNFDIVINIGANVGYYCCLALSLGKYVVAFEPVQLNVKWLLKKTLGPTPGMKKLKYFL